MERLLIDADMICHEIGHIEVETGETYIDDDGVEKPVKVPLALDKMIQTAKGRLHSLINHSECGSFHLFLTKGGGFRDDIATILPYKGNRRGSDRGQADALKEMFLEDYERSSMHEDHEADDEMSILQWEDLNEIAENHGSWDEEVLMHEAGTVICSRDKDLKNVPGWNMTWSLKPRGKKALEAPYFDTPEPPKVEWITKIEALRNFYKQMIMGDTADNIHGLFGKGAKSTWVTDLDDLDTEEDMYMHVEERYFKYFRNRAREWIVENGRLLHMLRTKDDVWEIPYEREDRQFFHDE